MDQNKRDSVPLNEVQMAIAPKVGNVTFLKKVNIEKGGRKYLAISTNRVLLLSTKSPYKIESSFHLLEIQSIECSKPAVLRIKLASDKTLNYVITTDEDDDVQFIVAQVVALLRHNFPGSNRSDELKLNVQPAEKLQNMTKLALALASPTPDTDLGPCGGFSLSYSSVCDLHGVKPMAEVIWDVDKIYGSHGCKNFNISDFDHLEVKELIPVIGTFEYNNWFQSFSCRSYKLSNELVDVLVKVFKSNSSIEELDFYECRLTKENIQKLSQAIASNLETGLKRINFGKNTIDDRGAAPFCSMISSLPHGLESLLIKDVSITGRGASTIFSALKSNHHMSSSLTCLNLSSNLLKADGASAVCEFLANTNVIQELHLSKSECSLELVFGAIARGCLQHLKVLNLAGNPYSYRKARETQIAPSVTTFFSSSMALETVNLSHTKVSPEFAKALLIGLIANFVLKDVSLVLSGNELRSAGAAEISSCIGSVTNVTRLDLSDNGLDMDLVSICHSLQQSKSLRHLDLSQNIGKSKNINVSTIIESFVELIITESLPLTSLSIADNRLRQDAYIIIDSLGTNGVIEELDISGNFIGDEGARLLAKALQINTKLKKVSIDRNGISLKGFHNLATSMERNYSLQLIPVPFADILPLTKNSGEAVTKCFAKIDELLLRNRSMEITEKDHSVKLKQNLLLNSLDQESTDYLLVKVQDAIAELKGFESDEAIAKEMESGKEAIKDADKMKQVLFKLFVDLGNPSKKIEERADKMLKEVTDFANALVKQNIDGTLTYLREQCSTIAANEETMKHLEKLVSVKGEVDSLGLKETITRTMVGLISNKVSDATLHVASAFAEYLTKTMQETLNQSKVALGLLSKESNDKQKSKNDVKKGDSLPTTPIDDQDESLLAAQKAKNRISMLSDDGTVKSKGVARRPTFRRDKQFEEVAVDISIDDIPGPDESKSELAEETTFKIVDEKEVGREQELSNSTLVNEEEAPGEKKKATSGIKVESKPVVEVEEKPGLKEGKVGIKVEEKKEEKRKEPEKNLKTDLKNEAKKETKAASPTEEKISIEIAEVKPRKGSFEKLVRPKLDANTVRAASVSVKPSKSASELEVGKKPRPLSDLSFLEIDRSKNVELTHLNKGRAKPKGRRLPTKAAGLAHLAVDAMEIQTEEVQKNENIGEAKPDMTHEGKALKTPPKPRPKSMQPLESPNEEREMGVIRTGSIPHKSSESMKARLKSEGSKPGVDLMAKPELKKSPKPEPRKKEDSIKKPKIPMGVPMPGLPNILGKPNLAKKEKSPSVKRDEDSTEHKEEKEDECKGDVPKKHSNQESVIHEKPAADNEQNLEVAEKPKAKKYKPPGGVPLMGGPMGFGGALMAEMKKKRGIKEKEPNPVEKTEEKSSAVTSPPTAAKPSPTSRKPPPPAKLSAEKRRSLILDAGAKPIILDKPDGQVILEKRDAESLSEKATSEAKKEGSEEKTCVGADIESGDEKGDTTSKISERNNNTETTENEA